MSSKILRALIREMLEEDVGSVTVSKGPRRRSVAQRAASAVGSFFFGDADESNKDEEVLDETDDEGCDETDEEVLDEMDEDGTVVQGSGVACEDDCGGGSSDWRPFG